MLDPEACRSRQRRFREALGEAWDAALVGLPEHLLYLANVFPSPTSLNLGSSSFLLIERDGPATVFTDNWLAEGIGQVPITEAGAADEIRVTEWYTGKGPAVLRSRAVVESVAEHISKIGVRRLAAETAHIPALIAARADTLQDSEPLLRKMRERKDPDELEAIRRGVRTAEAVHAASRELLRPGISEVELYAGLVERATVAAGGPFVMMCDLASGERAAQGGGPPTSRTIERGDLVILDIFPYVEGYRGDITNTLVCGGEPSREQEELFDLVHGALEAAEKEIRPGAPAASFYRTIADRFRARGKELVHHAGHAIGLGHPEAPELVPGSDRELEEGMVITLEPGVYGAPTGGIRLEHDYLVTRDSYERLSSHRLGLA